MHSLHLESHLLTKAQSSWGVWAEIARETRLDKVPVSSEALVPTMMTLNPEPQFAATQGPRSKLPLPYRGLVGNQGTYDRDHTAY